MGREEKLFHLQEDDIQKYELDNGDECEIYMPRSPKERVPFQSDHCEFMPVGWTRLGEIWYPLSYKVVTEDLKSLGLRRNPNIMTFAVCEWVLLPDDQVKPGMDDWGGVWTALRSGSVKTLKEHCQRTWGMETRGFLTAIHNPVFANSYRIKSQGVILLKEIV